MAIQLFKPFERFIFDDRTCFLSGKEVSPSSRLQVFPQWLLDDYKLSDKPFKLLDETITTYQEISVVCSPHILPEIDALEETIKKAFNSGYDEVEKLDKLKLFQWIGKLVYGIIYHEIRTGLINQTGDASFELSQSLAHKFGNLHLMLQSIISPVIFDGALPWTILVFPVDNPSEAFIYRDEINTLTFSVRMKNFGLIACLQDNGANRVYHQEILKKIAGHKLHPVQFEELCGRFFYSAYLFNRLPQYMILPTDDAVYIEAMPLAGTVNKPIFDQWQNKVYGQVLENFWKSWGFSLFEIIKDPERAMSFLLDGDDVFRPAETIVIGNQ